LDRFFFSLLGVVVVVVVVAISYFVFWLMVHGMILVLA
jgi:hypothetical protein